MSENYWKTRDTAIKFRSEILHEVTFLEKIIDTYLANHFCNGISKRVEDMEFHVFGDNRISFDSKRQIFYEIAIKYDKAWYNSFKPMKKENLNNELSYIITERNKLAHLIIDTDSDIIDSDLPIDEVTLLRFLGNVKPSQFNHQLLGEIIQMIDAIYKFIKIRIVTMHPSSSASNISSEPSPGP